ncbi:unnamed protein product [Orchesella dallaii]|uniref:Uncharacterized protein n=1 Tax=Orchesella dallaii TaxID=48710 RepID=A0ABP1QH54_9HEXA
MTATLVCPPNIPPDAAAGSGDSSLSNGFEASVDLDHVIQPGKEEDIDDENEIEMELEEKAHSSSAHTDDEIEEETKDASMSTPKKVRIQCNNNNNNNPPEVDIDIHIEDANKVENEDGGSAPPKPLNSILKATSAPPFFNRSPRWSERGSWKERESCNDTSDSDNENNNQESYASYKIGRKNLLKIERLTDSDSRGRQKMRSRALSPPSSSDEENLHIGWVAYPIVSAVPNRRRKGRSQNPCALV